MSALSSFIPQHPGLLPKWIYFISVVSLGNSLQSYLSLSPTRQVYSGRPNEVTPLSARTFGTWTLVSAIVRIYAAHHINEQAWYDAAMWVFAAAWVHFFSEWLVFGTARFGKGLLGPLVVSTSSLGWMWMQRGEYLR